MGDKYSHSIQTYIYTPIDITIYSDTSLEGLGNRLYKSCRW